VSDDVEFVSIRTKPEDVDEAAKPMIIVRQSNGKCFSCILLIFVYFDRIIPN
jgi:hypothetical protein